MPIPARSSPRALDLLARLAADTRPLHDDTITAARDLGRAEAARLVTVLIEDELDSPGATPAAVNAAALAGALRLTHAVPALVRCLERFDHLGPIAGEAAHALELIGDGSLGALLEALERSETTMNRGRLCQVLARLGVRDARIRAALVAHLDEDPERGAGLLLDYGDPWALPHLSRALDRTPLEDEPSSLWPNGELLALAAAIDALGGRFTAAQEAKVAEAVRVLQAERRDARILSALAGSAKSSEARRGSSASGSCRSQDDEG